MIDQWKIVRPANSNGGPCELLGPLLEEHTTRLAIVPLPGRPQGPHPQASGAP